MWPIVVFFQEKCQYNPEEPFGETQLDLLLAMK